MFTFYPKRKKTYLTFCSQSTGNSVLSLFNILWLSNEKPFANNNNNKNMKKKSTQLLSLLCGNYGIVTLLFFSCHRVRCQSHRKLLKFGMHLPFWAVCCWLEDEFDNAENDTTHTHTHTRAAANEKLVFTFD